MIKFPKDVVLIEEGFTVFCPLCESTFKKRWILFGKRYCINPDCKNNKKEKTRSLDAGVSKKSPVDSTAKNPFIYPIITKEDIKIELLGQEIEESKKLFLAVYNDSVFFKRKLKEKEEENKELKEENKDLKEFFDAAYKDSEYFQKVVKRLEKENKELQERVEDLVGEIQEAGEYD